MVTAVVRLRGVQLAPRYITLGTRYRRVRYSSSIAGCDKTACCGDVFAEKERPVNLLLLYTAGLTVDLPHFCLYVQQLDMHPTDKYSHRSNYYCCTWHMIRAALLIRSSSQK